MSLPNFICVGAQKAGTTTLHDILKQHPDVCLPKEKETHFFINGKYNYSKGIKWYEKTFFSHCKCEKLIGEITPAYMYLDYIPQRLYEEIGKDVKLIFILRDPVDRAYSQYLMNKRSQLEDLTFEDALKQEENRMKKDEFSKLIFSYKDRGKYTEQIENLLKFFPKKNMFFIIFETDFLQNKKETLDKLCDFLDIDQYEFNTNIKSNPASATRFPFLIHLLYKDKYSFLRKPFKLLMLSQRYRNRIKEKLRNSDFIVGKPYKIKPKMNLETKKTLKMFFLQERIKLQNLIGRDLSHWS